MLGTMHLPEQGAWYIHAVSEPGRAIAKFPHFTAFPRISVTTAREQNAKQYLIPALCEGPRAKVVGPIYICMPCAVETRSDQPGNAHTSPFGSSNIDRPSQWLPAILPCSLSATPTWSACFSPHSPGARSIAVLTGHRQ